MEIKAALAHEIAELASFARVTYAAAFLKDMGQKTINDHIETQMSDQHFEAMMESDTFYLARSESELIGFSQIGTVTPDYESYVPEFDRLGSEMRRLYVLSDLQSKGVGSALIEQSLRDPILSNSKTVYLTTWETNRAQKLYSQFKFKKVGEIPEYGAGGELNGHEHIMARLNQGSKSNPRQC